MHVFVIRTLTAHFLNADRYQATGYINLDDQRSSPVQNCLKYLRLYHYLSTLRGSYCLGVFILLHIVFKKIGGNF
jgi:hypothetical protein